MYLPSISCFTDNFVTLMSIGRVSVGQSNLRREFTPWPIVQKPVIFTSGRGNLQIRSQILTY